MAAWLTSPAQEADLRDDALASLRRATTFYDAHVAAEGGYLWRYSADLTQREGEGKVDRTTVWVQPPGTPAVGLAYLRCYEATEDEHYLKLARRAGEVLVRGQLRSGGWADRIELAPADRARHAYRVDRPPASDKARNVSTFDDNKTQSALRLLMRLDRTLGFKDATIHEAAIYALDRIDDAQFPSGGWSQVFDGEIEMADPPVKRASLPDKWARSYTGHNNHWRWYTLNDGAMLDTIAVMFEAGEVYSDKRYRDAAVRGADFLVLAQVPEPQPAWAQQYDYEMHPTWARKFEPPAVTGGESQRVMQTLIDVYRRTGDHKYLEPIPRALAYLRKSQLPDGRLARFYELGTNRPLYLTRQYGLTYEDTDLPTHYSFTVPSKLDAIEREYAKMKDLPADRLAAPRPETPKLDETMERAVRRAIDALDERGAWVTDGKMKHGGDAKRIIDMEVYAEQLDLLADYLAATRPGQP